MRPLRPVGRVLVAYVAAIVGILAFSSLAVVVVVALYPDVPEPMLLRSAPALVAGSLAAAAALALTAALMVRPLDPRRLRLLPGWETGRALLVMTVGMLALAQSLASTTTLVGLGDQGTLRFLREALEGVAGVELFLVVLSLGVVAPVAEEVFFRGYMQTELGRQWPAWAAVVTSSAAFAILHVDPTGVHMVLALLLGLYLGFLVELTGSTLPAIVCHVVNNAVFTLQTALGGTVQDRGTHGWLAVVGAAAFVACVAWLYRVGPLRGR